MEIKLNYVAFFFLISGTLFWVAAYYLMIKQAFRDKSIAYPLVANAVNWSWEFTYSLITPSTFMPSLVSNSVWLFLNSILLVTYFKFTDRNKFRVLFEFVALFFLMYFLILKIEFWLDSSLNKRMIIIIYWGFFACFMHGLNFLYLLKIEKTTKGQSVPIATCILLGSAGYVVEVALNPVHKSLQSLPLSLLMLSSMVVLLIYRIELIKEKRRESVV